MNLDWEKLCNDKQKGLKELWMRLWTMDSSIQVFRMEDAERECQSYPRERHQHRHTRTIEVWPKFDDLRKHLNQVCPLA
jgi:hypothetical protein